MASDYSTRAEADTHSKSPSASEDKGATFVNSIITGQSDLTLSATRRLRSPVPSTVKLRSLTSVFTPSASHRVPHFDPNAGESGPGSTGTIGLALGIAFGLLFLIALLIAIWCLVARDRTEETDAEGDVEFDTESDLDETFETEEPEECASGYQSEDLDQMIADEFAFSAVFSDRNEEMAAFSDVFSMEI
jgi:hypothetical protein